MMILCCVKLPVSTCSEWRVKLTWRNETGYFCFVRAELASGMMRIVTCDLQLSTWFDLGADVPLTHLFLSVYQSQSRPAFHKLSAESQNGSRLIGHVSQQLGRLTTTPSSFNNRPCVPLLSPQKKGFGRQWRRQIEPVKAPPRSSEWRAGPAHWPPALPGGRSLPPGQAVGAAPERGLPAGQRLLQRWGCCKLQATSRGTHADARGRGRNVKRAGIWF